MASRHPFLHSLRVVVGSGLIGATLLGAVSSLLSLSPAVGGLGVHEFGALIGGGLGLMANVRHLI